MREWEQTYNFAAVAPLLRNLSQKLNTSPIPADTADGDSSLGSGVDRENNISSETEHGGI